MAHEARAIETVETKEIIKAIVDTDKKKTHTVRKANSIILTGKNGSIANCREATSKCQITKMFTIK